MGETMQSVVLQGRQVRLEPLRLDHVDDLTAAATGDRSTFGLTTVPGDAAAMAAYVEQLLAAHRHGTALPFAQRRLATGRLVGCTRYLDPHWWRGRRDPDEVEIGGTWLSGDAQRTGVNTEAKLLLLRHAFEQLDVWRVAICTDERNERSRTAIERIGASFEGILRNHRLRADSDAPAPRNTAVYSIVRADWPAVERGLVARLDPRG